MRRVIGVGTAVFALAGFVAGAGAKSVGPALRAPDDGPAVRTVDGVLREQPPRDLLIAGSHVGAHIVRRTTLYALPGKRPVARIGRRTSFGGPQFLSVVVSKPGWIGVLHESRPNSRVGWVRFRDVKLVAEPYTIVIDRSSRMGHLRRWRKTVLRFPVSVGRSTSPTPVGRYAVTDRLAMPAGSVYGCCALALTARQSYLPSGWNGGDRIAMHGSADDGVGAASSSGCIRVRRRDLTKLMKVVPVGTRVTVRA